VSNRWIRVPTLFGFGIVLAYVVALIWAPHLPSFCTEIHPDKPCEVVAVQTLMGYLIIGLGVAVMILGPVVGALLELAIHGHQWETPRGVETVVTNVPIAAGIAYIVIGGVVVATV
jgi:hypothetical protein